MQRHTALFEAENSDQTLWETNGTAAGTYELVDSGGSPFELAPTDMTAFPQSISTGLEVLFKGWDTSGISATRGNSLSIRARPS
jgi:hypothetical protein